MNVLLSLRDRKYLIEIHFPSIPQNNNNLKSRLDRIGKLTMIISKSAAKNL
jgi:hypothetical protein